MDEGLARRAGSLSDFILMVREKQILAAAVNIEGVAQIGGAHGGAFDVPAGPAHAPRAFPRRFTGLLGLPQGEVQRILLQLVHTDPCAAFQIFQILAAQTAIGREGADAEIYVSLAFISKAVVHQLLDHGDDLGHMLRGPGMHRGGADAQRLGVHEIFLDVAVGDLLDRYALFIGLADHLVVDVGEILHEGHFVAPVF